MSKHYAEINAEMDKVLFSKRAMTPYELWLSKVDETAEAFCMPREHVLSALKLLMIGNYGKDFRELGSWHDSLDYMRRAMGEDLYKIKETP